ncbi:hypothetical protein BKG74_18300 [Mycobacteroides chelonae]|uniref:hypothetical protein n=1 Tax=Mycobacteroides chelonae TaxID=1774 RepID=UPI0008A95F35|nr:hypothetical protein [Mycobacteroides chelonae]OHU18445.1 hypothetical protein BKG74_18300 [Mycobacteroides chelonae]
MSAKRITAVVMVAGALVFPLAACGSSTPAPVVTVTATTTPAYPTYSSPCPLGDGFDSCMDTRRAERQAADAARPSARASSNPAQSKHDGGLPWWSWLLIVPVGLVAVGVLAIKVMERNDERTISHANARVAELESRPRPIVDYDDYEDDDELDELPEGDMEFLRKATDPATAPATPAPPAAGNLLSALRQQGGVQ